MFSILKILYAFSLLLFALCTYELNGNKMDIITFVASPEASGDYLTPSTMDYFKGTQYPQLSLIIEYLEKEKQKFEIVDWKNRNVHWSAKSKVILGPIWGYTELPVEFDNWLTLIEKNSINMVNSAEFLRWNINKKYLNDLAKYQIEVPNTLIIESNSHLSFEQAWQLFKEKYGSSDIVLKGAIDSGGFGYLHIKSNENNMGSAHFENLKKNYGGVVMQNFIPQIYKKGEFSFVFFDEKISHYFLKVPKLNEERVQVLYGGKSFHFKKENISEQIENIKLNFRSDLELTEQDVINAYKKAEMTYTHLQKLLKELGISNPNYLRIDGVMIDSSFIVMELEGIEPYLEIQEAMDNDPSNTILENYIKALLKQ